MDYYNIQKSDYYEFIDSEELTNILKKSFINDRTPYNYHDVFKVIKDIFSNAESKEYSVLYKALSNDNSAARVYKLKYLDIIIDRFKFSIIEIKNDYFLVSSVGNRPSVQTICDQVDGVAEFIKTFIKERINK